MSSFPTPFVVSPSSGSHTHTLILLHGLGSNGQKFGTEFLETAITSQSQTIQTVFPNLKLIFPTAKRSRSTIFKRSKTNQWFDVASLDDKTEREELEIPGLMDTSAFIRELIQNEKDDGILAKNIFLGGLSQGFAASVYTLFTLDEAIGGYVGMSGYFPFVRYVEDIMKASDISTVEDHIFESNEESNVNKPTQVVNFLRDNMDLEELKSSDPSSIPLCLQTPIFLGHGALDEKVHYRHTERARDAMESLGMNITCKIYDDLGHWYKIPEEIDDIVDFLKINMSNS